MCKWLVRILTGLYVIALTLLVIGTFGLFGQERDPLSGIFLVPLGLPWNMLTGGLPEAALPWVAALAPLLNILILSIVCRAAARASGRNI